MVGSIESWIAERPRWLQTAFALRLSKGPLTSEDYDLLADLCIKEACGAAKAEDFKQVPSGILEKQQTKNSLRLRRIEAMSGINALKPARPLEFGDCSLSVVYGPTGTGKTGYTRLLRHACGSRFAGDLHPDAFNSTIVEPKATFVVLNNGKEETVKWSAEDGPSDVLKRAHVFDAERAFTYLERANHPTFEPFVLQLFAAIIGDCGRVESRINSRKLQLAGQPPLLPGEFAETPGGVWYRQLSASTTEASVKKYCSISEAELNELKSLDQALSATKPGEIISDRKQKRQKIDALKLDLQELKKELAPAAGQQIRKLRATAVAKRLDATNKAKALFAKTPLKGVGGEPWRQMWDAAGVYSEEVAYPNKEFPVTSHGAACVLCQQELKDGAKRLAEFKKFIDDALEEAAEEAENALEDRIDQVPEVPDLDGFVARFDAIGGAKAKPKELHKALTRRRKWVLVPDDSAPPTIDYEKAEKELAKLNAKYGAEIKQMEQLQESDQRTKAKQKLKELSAKKWLSQQKTAIEADLVRRQKIHLLDHAKTFTDTTALTRRKNLLSEQLLADEHKTRFLDELKELGGSEIRIKVEHERADKAQKPGFALELDGAKLDIPVPEVLSDGEARVVALATFLADVLAIPEDAPFIFDDPITSLDYDFEIATAKRLVKEVKTRQVVVFTHRLSLLAALCEAAEKEGVEVHHQCLRIDASARGTPADNYLSETNPKKALNKLRNERIVAAKAALAAGQSDVADALIKSICMDLRVLLERLIERVLLNDIVWRFRRELVTKNKLGKLTVIKSSDCTLLDDMMTAYSFPLHLQPAETPLKLPSIDKLVGDIGKLVAWCEEFSLREP